MHNKGLIRLFAILFGLVSIYQLSFTFITNKAHSDAEAYAEQKISKDVKDYADLRQEAESRYLDSVANEPIFAGVTYNTAKEKQLNKGLDLKGGINVILQISVKDILRELSNHSSDPAFNKALKQADEARKNSQDTYAELFFEAFNNIPDAQLASPDIFANKTMSNDVTFDMSNEEVESILQKRIDESISSAFEVLRKRIDKFGVTQPNIQRLGNSGRILVELPGAKDITRIKKLLQSTAQLEFWHVYQSEQFRGFFQEADAKLQRMQQGQNKTSEGAEKDSVKTAADSTQAKEEDLEALLSSDEESDDEASSANPLLSLVKGFGREGGPILMEVALKDTAKVNSYLQNPQIRSLLSNELKYTRFAWGLPDDDTNLIGLYAIKSNKKNEPNLSGGVVTDATQTYGQMGGVVVSMEMNGKGAKIWEEMTGKAYKQGTQIAIVLDNIVYSAPGVTTGPISGGRSQISGDFTINEGKDLANVLKAGKLPASATIVQSEVVGPSLGHEAIQSGMISFIIALIVVLIFMIFYYGKAGIFADVALAVNILFIFGILAGLGAVLTLPGIAGIVLTIGMSVDANVLIFERIKEELRRGKSQIAAIKDGFGNALSSILDANITTGLTGLILLIFGTGPIKGFATTLLIGIATSLFTAIFVTRLFIDGYGKGGKKTLAFSTSITKNWFTNVHVKFIHKRKVAYIISGIAIVISLISLATNGLNQGVDFVGGRTYTVRFEHEINPTKVEQELVNTFRSAEAKTYGSDNQLKITTKYKVDQEGTEVDEEVAQKLFETLKPYLPENLTLDKFKTADEATNVGVMSSIKVGPTIADDIKRDSFWAVLGALIVMFLYILFRFRKWQFSLGAVVAVFHDTLIVLGIFSLTYGIMPFNMEINQAFIAAILTVVGYSLNDTVVVFDRIREYFREHNKWALSRTVNTALNSTLGRTVNTSTTTMLVLIAIFIFGAESIRGFMFALIIGIIVGTYSSLFIASPLMYDTVKKKGADLLKSQEDKEDKKEEAPQK